MRMEAPVNGLSARQKRTEQPRRVPFLTQKRAVLYFEITPRRCFPHVDPQRQRIDFYAPPIGQPFPMVPHFRAKALLSPYGAARKMRIAVHADLA